MSAPKSGESPASAWTAASATASAAALGAFPPSASAAATATGRGLGLLPVRFPWLMLPERAEPSEQPLNALRIFVNIHNSRTYGLPVPAEALYRCVASAHGWLVLAAVKGPRRLMLLNPVTLTQWDVPWPFRPQHIDRLHAALTSSPADPASMLVIASDGILAYCHAHQHRFTGWREVRALGFRYDAATSDILCVRTKVYLLDERRDLWRVDLADQEPRVYRRHTSFRFQGELMLRSRLRHYLVESSGLLLLVVSDEHHEHAWFFRMGVGGHVWVQVDRLRSGRVLLLGRGCSAAVPASAAQGLPPEALLFAHQPSLAIHAGATGGRGGGGEQEWFWTESRLVEGPDGRLSRMLLRKPKPMQQRQGQFTADSFWFFPVIDPLPVEAD